MARGRARPLPRALRRVDDETGGRPAEDADASGQAARPAAPAPARRAGGGAEPGPAAAAPGSLGRLRRRRRRRPPAPSGRATTSIRTWPSRPRSSTFRPARTRSPSSRPRGSAGRTTSPWPRTRACSSGSRSRPFPTGRRRATTASSSIGVASGKDQGGAVAALLDAAALHARPRPDPAGHGDERHRPGARGRRRARRPGAVRVGVRPLRSRSVAAPPGKGPFPPGKPVGLMRSSPAGAVALALGLPAGTAVDRALGADDPEPELSRAANQALWPATWDAWVSDPMRWADDGSPLLSAGDVDFLRTWFTDHVRAEGPLPTLRVGPHPYGLLPVSTFARRHGGAVLDHLENTLLDLLDAWKSPDSVPQLDPDASDVAPDEDAEEQASDVGAIYGATPHIRELRLRPVDDTYRDLNDLYSLRIDIVKLMCAAVPTADGTYADRGGAREPPVVPGVPRAGVGHPRRERRPRPDRRVGPASRTRSTACPGRRPRRRRRWASGRSSTRTSPSGEELVTGDVLGIVYRHDGRVDGRAAVPRAARRAGRARSRAGAARCTRPATARRARRSRSACSSPPDDDEDAVAELSALADRPARRRRRLERRRAVAALRRHDARTRCCASCSRSPPPASRREPRRPPSATGSRASATSWTTTARPRSRCSSGCSAARSASRSTASTRG